MKRRRLGALADPPVPKPGSAFESQPQPSRYRGYTTTRRFSPGGKFRNEHVKTRIAAHAEPWPSQLAKMKDADGGLLKAPAPEVNMLSQGNEGISRDDARRAYGNALDWYYTGDVGAANRATAKLNSASSSLKTARAIMADIWCKSTLPFQVLAVLSTG